MHPRPTLVLQNRLVWSLVHVRIILEAVRNHQYYYISISFMEKYHGFDKEFYEYLFLYIVKEGGLRLQVVAAELVNELQKNFDPKHNLNLYRKQYGNIYEALKAIKNQFYILDSMIIKMKKPQEVDELFKKGFIPKGHYTAYQEKLKENHIKSIEIMKINHQNKCKHCGQQYNVNVNREGLCSKKSKHEPLY